MKKFKEIVLDGFWVILGIFIICNLAVLAMISFIFIANMWFKLLGM